jgi:hypothetical protein
MKGVDKVSQIFKNHVLNRHTDQRQNRGGQGSGVRLRVRQAQGGRTCPTGVGQIQPRLVPSLWNPTGSQTSLMRWTCLIRVGHV